jgi:microcystin-dependent protein
MDAFIGEIRAFAFNYAPQDWAFCNGNTLPTRQNQALYGVIGNLYGGDNVNFALPNLQGRASIGTGTGPGLKSRTIAEVSGAVTITLGSANMPAHNHSVTGVFPASQSEKSNEPHANSYISTFVQIQTGTTKPPAAIPAFEPVPPAPDTTLSPATLGYFGATIPAGHENRQPFLPMNFCISILGNWPYRP